ncbi:MAG TPA: hypothetical protein PK490_00280 [Prosthecobacter sp.]|nr:hypothetical protein [Prosthecobacter sp.]HRK12687.1 hypothetical protein [Prosthecobacter sp.]
MNTLAHAQEQARRFNEAEGVQHEFRHLRMLRRLTSPQLVLPEDVADDLDWQQALTTCRQTRAISLHLP